MQPYLKSHCLVFFDRFRLYPISVRYYPFLIDIFAEPIRFPLLLLLDVSLHYNDKRFFLLRLNIHLRHHNNRKEVAVVVNHFLPDRSIEVARDEVEVHVDVQSKNGDRHRCNNAKWKKRKEEREERIRVGHEKNKYRREDDRDPNDRRSDRHRGTTEYPHHGT